MICADYHVHTRFCDGKDSPEDMVLAAIRKGMSAIGFSGHSHTAFDESWCMTAADTLAYKSEIQRLKEKYENRICIYCGVEQDLYSDADIRGYDYVIGSVHYVLQNGVYIPIDESPEILITAARDHFHDDLYALIEAYYDAVSEVCDKTHCDVIGHFDLITKFNENSALFDECDRRYVAAWKKAADRLLAFGKPFEINTGAISRGYRSVPYPSSVIRRYISDHGGQFLLSGDAHSADGLCFAFDTVPECHNCIDLFRQQT